MLVAMNRRDEGRFESQEHRAGLIDELVNGLTRGNLKKAVSQATTDASGLKVTSCINTDMVDALYTKYELGQSLESGIVQAPMEFLDRLTDAARMHTFRLIAGSTCSNVTDNLISTVRVSSHICDAIYELIKNDPLFLEERKRVKSNWDKSLEQNGVTTRALDTFYRGCPEDQTTLGTIENSFVPDSAQHTMVQSETRNEKLTSDVLERMSRWEENRARKAMQARDSRVRDNPELEGKSVQGLHRSPEEKARVEATKKARADEYWAAISKRLDTKLRSCEKMLDKEFESEANLTDVVFITTKCPGSDAGDGGTVIDPSAEIELQFLRSNNSSARITEDPILVISNQLNRWRSTSATAET
ncbi:hypothetical protein I302_106186 [Kwoniella bestiolae CBS 10118]|uniref:Uncharacterized protein n=1 Tax=Kwoniella bestiolae CBS 10118 TaxID=1296100 RepID=A0A1B9G3A2_9TREE|nr:hypothetical protein I302_05310 [Kwoniella bestiolae CBS 10118]OCF25490.1 hypothetical protein I302_05310 [Kwoniella bestiolae CBS 10118]